MTQLVHDDVFKQVLVFFYELRIEEDKAAKGIASCSE